MLLKVPWWLWLLVCVCVCMCAHVCILSDRKKITGYQIKTCVKPLVKQFLKLQSFHSYFNFLTKMYLKYFMCVFSWCTCSLVFPSTFVEVRENLWEWIRSFTIWGFKGQSQVVRLQALAGKLFTCWALPSPYAPA